MKVWAVFHCWVHRQRIRWNEKFHVQCVEAEDIEHWELFWRKFPISSGMNLVSKVELMIVNKHQVECNPLFSKFFYISIKRRCVLEYLVSVKTISVSVDTPAIQSKDRHPSMLVDTLHSQVRLLYFSLLHFFILLFFQIFDRITLEILLFMYRGGVYWHWVMFWMSAVCVLLSQNIVSWGL